MQHRMSSIFFAFALCFAAFAAHSETTFVVDDSEAYNAWPYIRKLGEALLVVYSHTTGHEFTTGNVVTLARMSSDDARTWSEPVEIDFAEPPDGEWGACGIPVQTGDALYWHRYWKGNTRWHTLVRTGDGKRFSAVSKPKLDPMPVQIMEPVEIPGRGLVSLWFAGDYRKQDGHSWGLVVSKDSGRTWEQQVVEANLRKADWPTEPSLIHLGGNRLMAVARCEQRCEGNPVRRLFLMTSDDLGFTWHRRLTNIGDVLESTPSAIYDKDTDLVTLYYFQRGPGLLKRRTAKAAEVFGNPMAWSDPVVVACGRKQRDWDSGNVNALRVGDSDYLAYYAGDEKVASVLVSVVGGGETHANSWEGRRVLLLGDWLAGRVRALSAARRCEARVYPTAAAAAVDHPSEAFAIAVLGPGAVDDVGSVKSRFPHAAVIESIDTSLPAANRGGASALPRPPVMQLRLRAPDIASDAAWEDTRKMIAENPSCCDEVWFSTGIGVPPLSVHAERAARMVRAANELKVLGIKPSLQFQATLGHGDVLSLTEDCSAKTWTGWTGSTGVEAKACNCPRQAAFIEYVRSVARLYAAFQPEYVWIDDDLRFDNHTPATVGSRPGCWCERCISDFNEATGGRWLRQTLDAAVEKDPALMKSWIDFSNGSIADVARAIAEEFRMASPGTCMALQHGMTHAGTINAILAALRDASGKSVGFRPGAGAYYDIDPNSQVLKSLQAARYRRLIGDPEWISLWTPEVESWPRVYGSRSAQSILIEGFAALMYGMDAVSMLVTHTGNEDRALYSRVILKPLADGSEVIKGYAASNADTIPVGFSGDFPLDRLYRFAVSGVPVIFGVGRSCGELTSDDIMLNRCTATSKAVQEWRNTLDVRGDGAVPALVTSPFVGLMLPRVSKNDGRLRSVAFLNVRIDAQENVEVLLRGLPDASKAVWRELRRPPVDVPLMRDGSDFRVVIPEIGAWNAGYLDILYPTI